MVAFIRQFLVLLLVLLQFAAPLVHAHIDDRGVTNGLHLHEFESLAVQADRLPNSVETCSLSIQSAIVELGAAIQHQPSELDDEDTAGIYYLTEHATTLPVRYSLDAINFSPQQTKSKAAHFLAQNLSRAPPL